MKSFASARRVLFLFAIFLLTINNYSCSSDSTDIIDPDLEIISDDIEEETNSDSEENDDTTDDSTTTDNDDSNSGNNGETDSDANEDNNDESENSNDNNDSSSTNCTNPSNFIFNEADGLVMVEFEDAEFPGNWKLRNGGNNFSGDGFMVWNGAQFFNEPGNGRVTYKIKISSPGTYRFIWRNAIKTGDDATEHNDTWLRFNDADDFYGKKGNSRVYPKGSGKSPNPKGASKDGWLKIFRSGNDLDFKWQSRTSDHDAHEIYVEFDNPGTYLMEVSARSSGHAIDKFVLFKNNWTQAEATSVQEKSAISCN